MPSWPKRTTRLNIMDEQFPPKSLEWYLDGAKWLVAISTGSIVFAFGMMKDFELISVFDKALFLTSALTLGFASISGVFTFLFITSYVNTVEYIIKKGKKPDETKDHHKPLHDKLTWWYNSMLWSFIIGIILFSAFVATGVITKKGKAVGKTIITPLKPENDYLIQDGKGNVNLILTKDSSGYFVKDISSLSEEKKSKQKRSITKDK